MTKGRSKSVLVCGDIMRDVIVAMEGPWREGTDQNAKIDEGWGGSARAQAVQLARTGCNVEFVGAIGEQDIDMVRGMFAQEGIVAHLQAMTAQPMGRLICVVGESGERSFLTDRGANDHLNLRDVALSSIDQFDALLLSGYGFVGAQTRQSLVALIRMARDAGVSSYLDAGSAGYIADMGAQEFLDLAQGIDVFFANEDEARVLSGSEALADQLDFLSQHFGLVVIKRGAEGATLLRRGQGELLTHCAPKIEMVDSTGAGDAFAASFVAAQLDGALDQQALEMAIEAGSAACQFVGQIQ